ncbi:hypothetical protein CEXT_638611 [Caerostris extrusa]|uniref:Uncharacterized protein n=1 Tax=Caerostris extrusa TaxID=172846 RepID=A0AAV4PWY6_CAEEX|nr:hypothetical protein CEXT_638611 [Caerostris extrusa]
MRSAAETGGSSWMYSRSVLQIPRNSLMMLSWQHPVCLLQLIFLVGCEELEVGKTTETGESNRVCSRMALRILQNLSLLSVVMIFAIPISISRKNRSSASFQLARIHRKKEKVHSLFYNLVMSPGSIQCLLIVTVTVDIPCRLRRNGSCLATETGESNRVCARE